jgi:hypothetical protein
MKSPIKAGGVWVLALVAAGITLLSGCGAGGHAPGPPAHEIEASGLFPDFQPGERHYVSRCGRGAAPIAIKGDSGVRFSVAGGPAQAGSLQVRAPVAPGENFPLTIDYRGHSRTYMVRCLPADFPTWRYEPERKAPRGFFVVSFKADKSSLPWMIVFDNQGVPRWWYNPGTRVLWGQILGNGDLVWARSFGDGYGLDPRMAWEIHALDGRLLRLVGTDGSIVDGHEYRELGNGNVLLDTYVPETADLRRVGGPARAAIVSAEVQEIDPHGGELWHWNSRGHISLGETGRWWYYLLHNPRRRLGGRETFDPIHINAIEPRGRGEVVISSRHTDAIYGIRRSSGAIRWKLGGTPTGKSLREVGDPARKLFGGQHDVRVDRNGDLSIFDNGKGRPRRPRVVFYRLDLKHRTARYLSQLNDPLVKRSHCCGSAREMAEGGWLVSWGDNPLITAFDHQGRREFRLHLEAPSFRAVPAPAGATSIAALDRGMEALESNGQ